MRCLWCTSKLVLKKFIVVVVWAKNDLLWVFLLYSDVAQIVDRSSSDQKIPVAVNMSKSP